MLTFSQTLHGVPRYIFDTLKRVAVKIAQIEHRMITELDEEHSAEEQHNLADEVFSVVYFENEHYDHRYVFHTLENLFDHYCDEIHGRQSTDEEIEDFLNYFTHQFRTAKFMLASGIELEKLWE